MRTLVAVAHCDDETLGAYTLFSPDTWILHCTDSAPLNLEYARKAGFTTREEYSAARRVELLEAMAAAGIPAGRCRALGIPDQEAARRTGEIAEAVARMAAETGAERVVTHAYEGGHPDHDAVACAVARAGLDNVWEVPLYSISGDQRFLDYPGAQQAVVRELTGEERAGKRRILGLFRSQAWLLDRFHTDRELFRPAPAYDFGAPPHAGTLYYETRPLGWTGAAWRRAVSDRG